MTKNNREAQNFVGMSDTMKHYELEKLVAEFEKEYPINYGRPYPHFEHGMPVATHIVQHFRTALLTAYTAGLSRGLELLPEEEKKLHEPGWDAGYKHGFNSCRSQASSAIKDEINNTHDK